MGHSVHLIVGQGPAIASFQRNWPVARVVDLRGGWQAIPVDETLQLAIEARFPAAQRPQELDVSPGGLEQALADATRTGGGLAYVETDYFGGTGGQSAMAYADGLEAMSPQRSRGGGGPINQALRRIGVMRSDRDDEFDTAGLGERRSMADYDPEGPVRLRTPQDSPTTSSPAVVERAFVPLWQVALVFAAAIAIGIFAAVTDLF